MNDLDSFSETVSESLGFLQGLAVFDNGANQIITAFIFIFGGWVLARMISIALSRYGKRLTRYTKTKLDDYALDVTRDMVTTVILILSFFYATRALTLADPIDVFIEKAVLILVTLRVTASLLKIFDFIVRHYVMPYAAKTDILDTTLIPTLERIVKVVIWVIVALMIISNLGYDITSVLAGLGIGGLAVALAAQETLSNFFGSISLFADKTFRIGDLIEVDGIQGTVKSVGLRSTRLETLEGTELILPNSDLSNKKIDNQSRRKNRRVDTQISVTYETNSDDLKKAMKILKDVVANNKDSLKHCRVHFTEFADFSLNLMLTYWVKGNDFEVMQKVQNDINMSIKMEFEKAKIEMAYPTRRLYMSQVK